MSRWTRGLLVIGPLALAGCLALVSYEEPWPCHSDADCSDGNVCRLINGKQQCDVPHACGYNGDCALDSVCVEKQCIPIECKTSDLSACAGFGCNPSTFQCWDSCISMGDCAPGYFCEEGACVPKPCDVSVSGECQGFVCREGRCLIECSSTGDCEGELDCVNGKCICDPANRGQCGGFACVGGRCGDSCIGSNECEKGLLCENGSCVPPSCQPNVWGACDGFRCVAGTCRVWCDSGADCEDGLACVEGDCRCEPSTTGQCHGFKCDYGKCRTDCYGDSHCEDPLECTDGQCVQPPRCEGTPMPCESLSNGSCESVSGCDLVFACLGGSFNCAHFDHACTFCDGHPGCACDLSTGHCEGGYVQCATQDKFHCDSQLGCTEGEKCAGTPKPCEDLSISSCDGTPGCAVQ